jgi:hypothetical protein
VGNAVIALRPAYPAFPANTALWSFAEIIARIRANT